MPTRSRIQPATGTGHRSILVLLALLFASAMVSPAAPVRAAAFTPGNIVVYRVGNGIDDLTNAGNPVFLDEFSPSGDLIQSIALPTSANGADRQLIASGTAVSEGLLTRSADRRYLVMTGYARDLGGIGSVAATTAMTVNRVVARVGANGDVDTTTALTDAYSTNTIRGVASLDGSRFWLTGSNGGIRTAIAGASSSTQISSTPANLRAIAIANDQLYASSGSTGYGLGAVGTGTPTSAGQTYANLPGFPLTGSPYAFFFADLTAAVAGIDTLYATDDTGGSLQKYSLVGGSWTSNGLLPTDTYRGVTGVVNGSSVTLYATRTGGSQIVGGGELVTITDSSGYNGAFSGTPTVLAYAASRMAFRGVALAPESSTSLPSVNLSVSTNVASEAAATVVTVTATASAVAAQNQTVTVLVSGTGISPSDYSLSNGTITIPAGQTTGSVTFTISDDAVSETTEVATLTISSPSAGIALGSTISQNVSITDNDGTGPTITLISAIQGSGTNVTGAGPYTVDAIVTGDYQQQLELRGFFIQEEVADSDGNPATSEGIFVFCDTCSTNVATGDRVQVTGTASEAFGMSQMSASSVTILSSSNPLPSATILTLPVPNVTATDLVGAQSQINSYYEPFEGMLVRYQTTLAIADYFELARYGQLILTQGGRPRQYTDQNAPGTIGYVTHLIDLARRSVILDDTSNTQNYAITTTSDSPYYWPRAGLSVSNALRGGDTITNLTGVLHWSFAGQAGTDAWRLRPVEPAFGYAFSSTNPRQATPASVGGTLKVGAMNVLNYFISIDTTAGSSGSCGADQTQDCRGADSAAERTRQQAKLASALKVLDADILGIIEMENTPNVNPLAQIVFDLNSLTAPGTYAAINTGVVGSDAIRVGMIYKPANVTPVGKPIIDTNPIFSRPPVTQVFQDINGQRFSVVINHFKSKGCTGATGLNLDQQDGQGCYNATRLAQAQALIGFITNAVIPQAGDNDVLILGDLNSYRNEDPISALKNAGYIDLIDTRIGANAYSYLFSAQLGYLDHALASSSMAAQVTGATEWHINADEPDLFDYNDAERTTGEALFERRSAAETLYQANPYRTSDHDPLLVGLNPGTFNQAPTLSTISAFTGAFVQQPYTITYEQLAASANEADPDSPTIFFRVVAVLNGMLTKNGVAVVPGTTVVGPGESLVYTPASPGDLNAFQVSAYDGALTSASATVVFSDVRVRTVLPLIGR